MFNAKGSGLTRMNLHSQLKKRSFMEENIYSVNGEITAVLFILSF